MRSESDWCRFCSRDSSVQAKKKVEQTDEILLNFLEGGDEEYESERSDSGIFVRRGDVGNLLNTGGEEEKDVGVFRELFYPRSPFQ